MDEKISPPFLPGQTGSKHPSFPVFRLLGMFLVVCLLCSYFGMSAAAQSVSHASASTSVVIPKGATPAGWQAVQYNGVTLAVPSSWPVFDLSTQATRCVLFNAHAVYLDHQGANALCPAHALGKSEALQIESLATVSPAVTRQATSATTVAGVSAQVNATNNVSHTFVVVLKQAGAVIQLSYGHSPKLARQILGTLHVSSTRTSVSTRTAAQATVAAASEPAGVFQGQGFDACTAPSAAAMSAWLQNSSYHATGIYIGGANRACGDGNLSASWVSSVTGSGWSLMPFYVGLQAPCNSGFATIDPGQAASEGSQAADDAVNLAQGFGLGTGTLLLNDLESYDTSNSGCSQAVMTFLSAWTQELHARNYLSGVYSSLGSGISDLINYAGSIQEPDTIDFADWDGVASTSGAGLPSNDWDNNQRIKQYQGGHNETYGGYTINIDNDQLDTTLYGGSNGGGVIPAPPGSSVVITSVPGAHWWITTFANAPGYRGGWTQVGTLNAGTSYVFCKQWGAQVSSSDGSSFNHYWFWTDLDTGGQGWVSAYYLSLWGNDQALDNNGNVIPDCPTT